MQEEAQRRTALELTREVWKRRRWLALPVFAASLSGGASLVAFLPNVYQATATVLVERQQVPESFVRPTVTSVLETRIQTISQEILSRSRLEELVTRFGLYQDSVTDVPEQAIGQMRRAIRVNLTGIQRGGATIAFTISYRGIDPRTVALVTNTLASFYVEENLKVRERQASGTTKFLKGQLEETKKRLDDQERRVSAFKRRYLGELPQQMQANLAMLERLNAQLRLNSENQVRLMEQREALVKQLAEADSFTPASGPGAIAVQIAQLRQQLQGLETRFTEKYPDVVQTRAEIAALEQQLAETRPDGTPKDGDPAALGSSPYALQVKRTLSDLESELKALRREKRRLETDVSRYQQRVENSPRREQEFAELSRDYTTTTQTYTSLLRRYEEARLAENLEARQKGEQFRILDPAIPSHQPAAPNRHRLIFMTLILSLGLAAGATALAEHLDTSFHSVDDLRSFTQVPVLVRIPRIVTKGDANRRWWRVGLAAISWILGLPFIVAVAYFLATGNERLVRMLARF